MSLLAKVKSFAENARAVLMDKLRAEMEADTAKVKWQGYNSDGIPLVKNGDQVETARGQGGISNQGNSSQIYDKAGSVEYPKRTQQVNTRYNKKPLEDEQPLRTRKKVADVLPSSASEFALAIVKKNVAADVICIAVIDENNGTNTETDWALFRAAYPQRRFFLLQPDTGFGGGGLFVPSAFSTDNLATHQVISTSADWYSIAGLDQEPIGTQCILFIDQSGSMTINTVLASYNSFKSQATTRLNKVAVVDNGNEDYIAPFYIIDDYFNVANYQSNWPQ